MKFEVEVPEPAIVTALVSLSITQEGDPVKSVAVEYAHDDLKEFGQVAVVTLLRELAASIEAQGPGDVVRLPNTEEEEDDDE